MIARILAAALAAITADFSWRPADFAGGMWAGGRRG